ncbi:MAG: PstS family phosphate ABC transporter substrate-binding protein [Chloroflexaceae bacterium]|nr:PstS family phosphate ABC transporter substrate-binding protein [Chloroflexaceae bacterium]
MNTRARRSLNYSIGVLLALCLLVVNASCRTQLPKGQSAASEQQPIEIDGSSTVYPISNEAALEYQLLGAEKARIVVKFSGTTGGFRRFCRGETTISNASRPISQQEIDKCRSAGVEYIELPVAYDALTVVVNPENTSVKEITTEELRKIWEPQAQGKITQWSQVRAGWPDQPLELFGAGQDSGTFDYFTEAIVGESGASRSDYQGSEDDAFIVRGVVGKPNALGYFGYAYYEENRAKLRALAIDNGAGPVYPSAETVKNNQYQPLSRPLFIYVNAKAASRPEVRDFIEFYLSHARDYAKVVGYVPLTDELYALALDRFQNGKVGTVFAGKSQISLSLKELLEKEANAK